MSKVRQFNASTFINTAMKIEKQYNMKTAEKKTFRAANLYRALRREIYYKKGI